MFNIKVLGIATWMTVVLLVALPSKSNAADGEFSLVISNEINSSQTVNLTCTTYRYGHMEESKSEGLKIIHFGNILSTKTESLSSCEFTYFGGRLIMRTWPNLLTDPNIILDPSKTFLKFNETGPYRRNTETKRWVYLNPQFPKSRKL
ncbi:hypothetical protein ACH5RR_016290 [Cinchona calisaya]|uniref:S-protein homolog n=1 Tax=Cinchona calisaya TaxID=153742 RepID=A0ABD2ZVF9_9GENT